MAKIAKKVKLSDGVSFTFEDKDATQLRASLSELSEAMVTELAIHGLSQKIGDSYSGIKLVKDAIASAKQVWENLKAGKFNAGGGVGGILAEAVARIKGIELDEAVEKLNDATEEQLEALRKNPKVKAMVTVIKGERAADIAENADDVLEI